MTVMARIEVDDKEAKIALASMAANIRRTAEVGLYFAEAAGVAIDTVLRLYVEAGLRSIEFITATNAAIATGTLGAGAIFRLGAQAAAVALMFAQINAIQTQRTESAQSLGKATMALRALTYFMVLPLFIYWWLLQ